MIDVIATEKAPGAVGPYSQALRAGDFLFASGQVPLVPETGAVIVGDIQSQTEQALKNVAAILAEAGVTFDNVVKTTVFITDMSDFAKINEVYAKYFKKILPARSCVAVKELPKGVSIEIEVIAYCK